MNKIIFGFLDNTTPKRFPNIIQTISQSFKSMKFEVIYWGYDFIENELFLPFSPDSFETNNSTLLDENIRNIWIERLHCKSELTFEEAKRQINTIEEYATYVLNLIKPVAFIGWNNLEYRFGIVSEIARIKGIKVYNLETGPILQSWRLDVDNYAKKIFYPPKEEYFVNRGKTILKNIQTDSFSLYKHEVKHSDILLIVSAKKENKRIVLVLGALESDIGALPEGTPEKDIMLPGFKHGYEIASEISQIHSDFVVYKPHPLYGKKFPGFNCLKTNVLVSYTDPIILIDTADLVISVSGKLIVPLVLKRKKIINIGIGYFGGLKLGFEANSKESLLKILTTESEYKYDVFLENLYFALGYLYSTSWLLFPDSGVEIPEGCLTLDKFVDQIINELPEKLDENIDNSKYSIIKLNHMAYLSAQIKPAKVVYIEPTIRQGLKTLLSLNKWKKSIKYRFKLT